MVYTTRTKKMAGVGKFGMMAMLLNVMHGLNQVENMDTLRHKTMNTVL